MTVTWSSLLRPTNVNVDLAVRSLGGTPSLSGFTQVIASDTGLWNIIYADVHVRTPDAVLALREMADLLEGRLVPCLVPVFDKSRAPWPVVNGVTLSPDVTRERTLDGTEYESPEIPTDSEIVATLSVAAAQRATSLSINVSYGGRLRAGHLFSLGERLYRVRSVESTIGSLYDVTIRPSLRESAVINAVVNFSKPVCKARLLTDKELFMALELQRYGSVTVNFIEDPF